MNFALSAEWYMQDKIILVRATNGNVGEHDIIAADEILCRDFLDRTFARQLHVIFDYSRMSNAPRLHTVPRFTSHPKLGRCVSFGSTTFKDMFGRQVRGQKLESFNSLDDCLNFLLQSDPYLPRRLPKYL